MVGLLFLGPPCTIHSRDKVNEAKLSLLLKPHWHSSRPRLAPRCLNMKSLLQTFVTLSTLVCSALSVSFIVPGAVWTDTSGQKISAHGGHVVKVGSTFYWASPSLPRSVFFYGETTLMRFAARSDIQQTMAFGLISTALPTS
jgi:hypothetical protein